MIASSRRVAESVCMTQGVKRRRGCDCFTVGEKRTIIKAVKEAYDNLNWKRGGTKYGRRF